MGGVAGCLWPHRIKRGRHRHHTRRPPRQIHPRISCIPSRTLHSALAPLPWPRIDHTRTPPRTSHADACSSHRTPHTPKYLSRTIKTSGWSPRPSGVRTRPVARLTLPPHRAEPQINPSRGSGGHGYPTVRAEPLPCPPRRRLDGTHPRAAGPRKATELAGEGIGSLAMSATGAGGGGDGGRRRGWCETGGGRHGGSGAGGGRWHSQRTGGERQGVVATALAVRPRTGRSTARGRLSPRRGHVRARRGGHLRLAPQRTAAAGPGSACPLAGLRSSS